MPYPKQPRCARCRRAGRNDGLCKAHHADYRQSGLTLSAYLARFRLPGPGTPIPYFDPETVRIFRDGTVWKRRRQGPTWTQCKATMLNGVVHVCLPNPRGGQRRYSVARLMCRTFDGPRPLGNEPLHYPDPDPWNNRAENVRWAPIGTNKLGKDPLPGRHPDQRGEKNPCARLTADLIPWVRAAYRAGSTALDIATELQVSDGAIREVLRGRTWAHIPDPHGPVALRAGVAQGPANCNAKLDELAVLEMRKRAKAGEPKRALAQAFRVSLPTVYQVVNGDTWKHVQPEEENP